MRKYAIAALLFVSLPVTSVNAQLQLPGLGAKRSGGATSEAPSGDALVDSFVQSQTLVVKAQATLAEALSLTDELAKLQAEQKRLSSGQLDTDALRTSRELSRATQDAIDAALAAQPQLSAAQREKFAEGLVDYVRAVGGGHSLLTSAQRYVSTAGSNPLALVGKAKAALWVGKEIPGYVKGLAATTRQLIDYAKRNKVKTPANATAALDGL
ncbi:MAG TPA: hypothetical protein VEY50_07345 [Lysobacter sp.]|nr:hypothetical protein [Lysobacter sp.]